IRPQLRRFLGDHVLIGHNVEFDLGFLREEGLALGSHRLDTLTLATILYPTAGRYGLESLSRHLGLMAANDNQAHRALDDARQTAALFGLLQKRALELDLEVLDEIIRAGQKLGWPETIFFTESLAAAARRAFESGSKGSNPGRLKHLFQPAKLTGRPLVAAETPTPLDVPVITGLLQPEGNFSRLFPNYEYRPQQVQMVEAVAQALNRGQHLLVEAGTGTGKSVAYLMPAAFWANQNGRRVVVSTNTINLQDQLIQKDLPALQRILPFEVRSAVLKGKRNYLCTRLFQQMRHSGPANADEMALYGRLLIWLPQSTTGDVNEISLRNQGENMAWSRLSADNDVCQSRDCDEAQCPLSVARRRAEQAHVLVVNHALLLADIATDNRVLPEYADLVIDEAHHLEAAVTDSLSFRTDKRYLEATLEEVTRPRAGLVADLQSRAKSSLPAELSRLIDGFANRVRETAQTTLLRVDEFFTALAYFLEPLTNRRSQFAEQVRFVPDVYTQTGFDEVQTSWDNLYKSLTAVVEGLGKLAGGLADVSEGYPIEDGETLRLSLVSLARTLDETRQHVQRMVRDPAEGVIYWAEVFKERISLHAAPLHVGPLVEKHIFTTKEAVILTSATLRTAEPGRNRQTTFTYLRDRLNAQDAQELAVGSPFDYKNSTLVYLCTDIPEPQQPGYQSYVEQAITTVAQALGGRTIALFTANAQLAATGRAIERPLAEANLNLLLQTEGSSRQQLLTHFKADGSRSVLLGTRSFWEGVDVPGDALQCIVIVKLPFDVPSDPIFAARSETYDNPFYQYSVPEAVLRFRQGFGRLIRRQDDQGIVVILDKRVLTKSYGQLFLDALPDCTIIRQPVGRLGELSLRWLKRAR
ncbi:MAG: helicase C-terminal domain-containing protein, partial [Chloroflexota bacterium]